MGVLSYYGCPLSYYPDFKVLLELKLILSTNPLTEVRHWAMIVQAEMYMQYASFTCIMSGKARIQIERSLPIIVYKKYGSQLQLNVEV